MEKKDSPDNEEASFLVRPSGPTPAASLMQARFAAASRPDAVSTEPIPWTPTTFFFYGTLMDPDLLQSVLGLPDKPQLQQGTISNFRTKMWGIYPALVRAEGARVEGMVWEVKTQEQFQRLRNYETSAYTWTYCNVDLSDGGRIDYARTFQWDGHPDSRELEEGTFDFSCWQKHFKPSMLGKPAPDDGM